MLKRVSLTSLLLTVCVIAQKRPADDALFELIKTDPGRARAVFDRHTSRRLEGMAVAIIEDYLDDHKSTVKWRLDAGAAGIKEIFFDTAPPALTCPSQVAVEGFELRGRMVATSAVVTAAATGCPTTGAIKIAVLMINMPSQQLPANMTSALLHSAYFGAGRSVDTFWREGSYAKTSATGNVFGPFTLSADYTCDATDDIFTAVRAAVGSAVDFTAYNIIAMILPRSSSSCPGGVGQIGCFKFSPTLTTSPQWVFADTFWSSDATLRVAAHESGHNLGLNHSNSLDFGAVPLGMFKGGGDTEYGDKFSTMGDEPAASGGQYVVAHYPAPHKSALGWFAASNVQQVETSGSFTVLPYETSQTGLQALKIRRGAGNDAWLWLEYRQALGFDANLSTYSANLFPNSALIHYTDSGFDPLYSHLLDFNAVASPNNFSSSPFQVSRTWQDPYSLLNLQLTSANSAGLNVAVLYDTPCATLSTAQLTPASSGGAGVVNIAGPAGCSWTAASSDSWFTITSGASGSGNGSVNYTAAANPTPTSRSGFLVIARQTIAVTQAGQSNVAPVINSVSPSSGTGAGGRFTFTYTDGNGANDIQYVIADFTSPGGNCYVFLYPGSQSMGLLADDGVTFLPSITAGSAATTENSSCKVYSSGSSSASTGNSVTFTVQLDFKASLAGTLNVRGSVTDNSNAQSRLASVGSWQVPCAVTLSAASVNITSAGTAGNVSVAAAAGCAWTATSGAAWLSITSGASGSGNGTINYSAAANTTNTARSTAITASGQVLTVNQAAPAALATPSVSGMIPAGGTGTFQTFSFTFASTTGYQSLNLIDVLMNNFLDGRKACYVAVVPFGANAATIYLVNDAGDSGGPFAGMNIPGNSVVQNSQCVVSGSGSSISGTGNNMVVNLAIQFKGAFSGNKIFYTSAATANGNTGWQVSGTWNVPGVAAALSVAGANPTHGTGAGLYTFTFTDTAGNSDLSVLNVLMNNFIDGRQACYVAYVPSGPSTGTLYLVNDAGDSGGPFASMPLPGTGTVRNSQCAISGAGSSASSSGNTLTLTLNYAFPNFSGNRVIYGAARNSSASSDWQAAGSLTLP